MRKASRGKGTIGSSIHKGPSRRLFPPAHLTFPRSRLPFPRISGGFTLLSRVMKNNMPKPNRWPGLLQWAGSHELILWIALALIAFGIWGFAELADEVMGGETRVFDQAVIHALRNPADPHDPVGPPWIEEIIRDFSALGGFGLITFFSLAGLGYLLLRRRFRAAVLLALAVSGGGGLSLLLKWSYDRPRPELVAHGVETFSSAFPSGHSMMAAVVYLSLGAVLARLQPGIYLKAYIILIAMLITLLVGASRVYLGVHWPTDVAGGWLAGSVWALGLWLLVRHLQRSRTIEAED